MNRTTAVSETATVAQSGLVFRPDACMTPDPLPIAACVSRLSQCWAAHRKKEALKASRDECTPWHTRRHTALLLLSLELSRTLTRRGSG